MNGFASGAMPALLTAQSRPPNRSTAVSTIAATASSSTTSARDRDRVAVDRARRADRLASSMSATTTLAPRCRERQRDRAADAAAGAGHQRDLPSRFTPSARPWSFIAAAREVRDAAHDRPFSAFGIARREREHRVHHRVHRLQQVVGEIHHRGRAFGPHRGARARPRSRRCRRLPTRSRTTSSCGRARPCSARRSTSAPAAAPGPGSTIALVMFTIQPEPRSRMPGTTALVRRYGVITFTSYATRKPALRRLVDRQVEARGRVVDEHVDGPELAFHLRDDRGAIARRVGEVGHDRERDATAGLDGPGRLAQRSREVTARSGLETRARRSRHAHLRLRNGARSPHRCPGSHR